MQDLLFYDIEVFKEDALVIFKDIDKNVVASFHNNFEGVLDVITGKTLVGYNNYWYDDNILTAMINQWTPAQIKKLNDRIIVDKEKIKYVHPAIYSLDCMQEIDKTMPALKKIEGNFGKSIIESKIDFTIDRKLTDEELKETFDYCSYDIDSTIEIYKLREKEYFEPKKTVIEMFPPSEQEKVRKWNTTTISANIITKKPLVKWYDIRLGPYDKTGNYELLELAPEGARELWKKKESEKAKYIHEAFGCQFDFSFGGLHGVPLKRQLKYENVKLLDVASLYPNLMVKLNVFGESTKIYKQIVDKRLSVKHTDPKLSGGLKLIINSGYGLLKNKYSILYNPKASTSICVYGQIIMYDLCRRLSPTCKLININTDGVAFSTTSDDYKRVWKEWENDYGLTLELEDFDLFVQKGVNDYVAVNENRIKTKGPDITRYNTENVFRNNNMRIVDIAIVNKLLYGKDVLETLTENVNNPKLYQIVLQAGTKSYAGTCDQDGNMYQNVNRVFPAKKDGISLYKKRFDGGLVRFADVPDKMIVWNDDVDNFKDFSKVVDLNFYYQLVNKKIERWVS